MTIRLLHAVGDDKAGSVLSVGEDRARRLILTGYAEPATAVDELHAHATEAVARALTRKRKKKE